MRYAGADSALSAGLHADPAAAPCGNAVAPEEPVMRRRALVGLLGLLLLGTAGCGHISSGATPARTATVPVLWCATVLLEKASSSTAVRQTGSSSPSLELSPARPAQSGFTVWTIQAAPRCSPPARTVPSPSPCDTAEIIRLSQHTPASPAASPCAA